MLASAVVIGARLWAIGDLENHVLVLSPQVAENYFTLIVAPGVETRTAGPPRERRPALMGRRFCDVIY